MIQRNFWTIEEVPLEGGSIGHRQSQMNFMDFEDGSWNWVCPVDRLDETQVAEWNRVMGILQNVNGEDFRHIVCAVGLMDHCHHPDSCDPYAE